MPNKELDSATLFENPKEFKYFCFNSKSLILVPTLVTTLVATLFVPPRHPPDASHNDHPSRGPSFAFNAIYFKFYFTAKNVFNHPVVRHGI